MKLKYVKANPTENKTILVQSDTPRYLQAVIAGAMLAADADAEQVGFFEKPGDERASIRLQMMGGEFCGNASISAAAKVAEEKGIKAGEQKSILIEVSGAEGIVECTVGYDGAAYTGTVDMPLPNRIERLPFEYKGIRFDLWVVFLPGIVHIIFENEKSTADYNSFAESAIKEWAENFKEEAVGLIHFDEGNESITPLVYVKSTDSLYWERGCGTGTAAVGAYVSYRDEKSVIIPVKQPGGIITTEACFEENRITRLKITGKVFFEEEGVFDFEI